jgi:hypothetical protein
MKYKKEEEIKTNLYKTFESFIGGGKGKWDEYENIAKPTDQVDLATKKRILDVNNFNEWLKNDFTGYGYQQGAPGLVGRSDKLSYSMIVSYFLAQGVECEEDEIIDFQNKIRKQWQGR